MKLKNIGEANKLAERIYRLEDKKEEYETVWKNITDSDDNSMVSITFNAIIKGRAVVLDVADVMTKEATLHFIEDKIKTVVFAIDELTKDLEKL